MSADIYRKNPKRCYLFPKSLGSAVEWSANPVFAKQGFTNSDVITRWPEIVGEELASLCSPVRMTQTSGSNGQGQLVVKVKTGAAAMRIQISEPVILERLATFYGYRVASRVVILQ